MQIYLKEKINNPELFTGRKSDIAFFLKWINRIKLGAGKSTALLSRRKTGKSALMQRLYNIIFHKNDKVVPFYYEIKETNQWLGTFAKDFFLNFIYQYIAFKTRKSEYLSISQSFKNGLEICDKEGLDYLTERIKSAYDCAMEEDIDFLWEIARETPRIVAGMKDERVVQMIDEFQYINRFICRDKDCEKPIKNLGGSYLHTVEYKIAPLLVSGSWVGWLMDDLSRMLPGRFVYKPMGNMPQDEAVEMIFKYSLIMDTPVNEDTAWMIAKLTEGNPFYISALFDSPLENKDLSTPEGVRRTLEYETLHIDGSINATWMEYINDAFPRINDVYAKNIVLYLSKNRNRRVSRKELKKKLGLDMTDPELEKKFKALFKSDIIEENYGCYRGIQDNIFDKVFRRSYTEDIDNFVTKEAPEEYKQLFDKLSKKYKSLSGEYNRYKGAFAEFIINSHLRSHSVKNQELFKSMIENLPHDFDFTEYESVWEYHSPPLYEPEFQIDIFAKAAKEKYSLIWEIKNRENKKFSLKEAETFMEKIHELIKLEKPEKFLALVFSSAGFNKNAINFLEKNQMAWTSDMEMVG